MISREAILQDLTPFFSTFFHPGPDAVQADAVELGQIGTRQQLLDAVVVQARAPASGPRQRAGVGRLRRVETVLTKRPGLAAAWMLAETPCPKPSSAWARIARLRRLTGRQPIGQQAKALKHRVDLAVVIVGVAHIGEIALVPGVAHGLDLLWGVGEPARKLQPSRHGSLWGMSINAAG